MKTAYQKKVDREFEGNIDDEKWHDDPRIRVVQCGCGNHHAHLAKSEYAKVVKGTWSIVFDCGEVWV